MLKPDQKPTVCTKLKCDPGFHGREPVCEEQFHSVLVYICGKLQNVFSNLFTTIHISQNWKGKLITLFFFGLCHYENAPIQIYRKFYLQNLKIFR